jgi:hypothetical protein
MPITKAAVYEVVKERGKGTNGITFIALCSIFSVNRFTEEDRPKLWRLAQCLAELVHKNWIGVDRERNHRIYYIV